MSAAPTLPTFTNKDMLSDHRERFDFINQIVAGQAPLSIEDDYVHVYTVPRYEEAIVLPKLKYREYGVLDYSQEPIRVRLSSEYGGGTKVVVTPPDPNSALELLSELESLVRSWRSELARVGNKRISSNYTTPSGQTGHLLSEYKGCLDFIQSERYRQRRRMEDPTYK